MRRFAIGLGTFLLAAWPAFSMSLTSSDFSDGGTIPQTHLYLRCGGQNVSPQMSWKGVPKTAKSLILTMVDIDVPPNQWSHWIVVGLSPDTTGLERGFTALPAGARGVQSNFGEARYDGPCPPEGSGTHHYRFTLWALSNETMSVSPNGSAIALLNALSQVAIDRASITGTVRR